MNPIKISYESMGTHWEITIWDDLSDDKISALKHKIINDSTNFDHTFSRFKKDSFVTKISKESGKIKVPEHFVTMLKIYKDLYSLSSKKLNPLVGNALEDLGYDANYSLIPNKTISKVPNLSSVSILDEYTIEVNEPVLFDFGALGKGYFVDYIKDILIENKIKHFLVNGSGDIYYLGENYLKAGLEHPSDPTKVIGTINIKNIAICASANNRRAWGKYSHTVDPHNLNTHHEIIATWVLSQSTALADALATTLFFVEPERLQNEFEFKYLLLNKNYKVKYSEDLEVELF